MMNTFESTLVIIFVGWLFMTKTWIGRSIINVLRGIISLTKSVYFFSEWGYKQINNLNKKMKYRADSVSRKNKTNPNTSEGDINSKVIDLKSRKTNKAK